MYSTYAKARDKKGYTDYRVSVITGIAQSTLSDWKNGISTPKSDKLLKIANVVEINVEELIPDKIGKKV